MLHTTNMNYCKWLANRNRFRLIFFKKKNRNHLNDSSIKIIQPLVACCSKPEEFSLLGLVDVQYYSDLTVDSQEEKGFLA